MGDKTKIEWSEATWTPIRARNRATGKVGWHCERVTPGCEHCYSESLNKRHGTGLPFKPGHRADVELFLDEEMLLAPLRWRRPRMIFVCSMTDLFATFVPDAWIDRVFAVMALAPQHTFQVLTKRAGRMREWFSDRTSFARGDGSFSRGGRVAAAAAEIDATRGRALPGWPLPNVWLGVSAEDQRRADERCSHLLKTPAAVWFVSAEPLLGPIDFTRLSITDPDPPQLSFGYNALRGAVSPWLEGQRQEDLADPDNPRLDWVIVGGESGRGARPMHPDWARSIRDQCKATGTPFFFKQWGEWRFDIPPGWTGSTDWPVRGDVKEPFPHMVRVGKKTAGRLLDGREHSAMP